VKKQLKNQVSKVKSKLKSAKDLKLVDNLDKQIAEYMSAFYDYVDNEKVKGDAFSEWKRVGWAITNEIQKTFEEAVALEMTSNIKQVAKNVTDATSAMKTQEIVSATDEQNRGMTEIARAMSDVQLITQEINTSMEEQQTGANEVSRAMEKINSITQEVKNAMKDAQTRRDLPRIKL